MTGYLFLFSIPVIFAFVFSNQRASAQKLLLFFVAIIFIIFTGFRHEISKDWDQYIRKYSYINESTSFTEALSFSEPGFVALNWLLGRVDIDFYGVNFVVAIIFITGLFRFAGQMPRPWLALLSVTPYLVIVISMSAVRQAAAIGFVLYLLAGWNKDSFFKKIILALIATSFHYSAFIAFLFVLQSMKMSSLIRWGILLAGSAISFVIFSRTEQYTIYEGTYVTANIYSAGALQHALLNAIPAMIYLIFIKKWNKVYGAVNLLKWLSYLSLISVMGVFISSTAVDRLALYLSPIQMMVYSSIPIVFRREVYSIAIIVFHIAILLIWLNYANSAYAFLPYQNVLFL